MKRRYGLAVLAVLITLGALWILPASAKSDRERRVLSKVTFIHYRRGHAKPPSPPGLDKKGREQGDYTYIANGAKWRVEENFLINPSSEQNPDGSQDGVIIGAALDAMDEWEAAGDGALPIFGDLFPNPGVAYGNGAFRGYNTVSFGDYGDSSVIGVTSVWGYFTGKPRDREIIEAHVLLNDQFVWGDALADPSLMDVQNILTHELGHAGGMGDLYDTTASEETMYGYSGEGETKKRDLYFGDAAGIARLYR